MVWIKHAYRGSERSRTHGRRSRLIRFLGVVALVCLGLHWTTSSAAVPTPVAFASQSNVGGIGSVARAKTYSRQDAFARKSSQSTTDSKPMKLFSPAKINLMLRIIGKRPDNYHELASLFHTVGFGDTLSLEILPATATHDELECNLPGVPVDDSNLVIRALNLFRQRSGLNAHFRVSLEKQIPAQAGMGGGSSNAATAFFGANALCGKPASAAELIEWAEDPVIGSDATFFLTQGAAYCTGRGEIVRPVEPLPVPPELAVYLVKPGFGLSTPKVFKALDLSKSSDQDPEDILSTFQQHGVGHSSWVNDLEQPAFDVSPELGNLKDFLADDERGFEAVMMSGSGSTIFCVGEPRGGSEAFEEETRDRFNIEGIWRTQLHRRENADEWYSMPNEMS